MSDVLSLRAGLALSIAFFSGMMSSSLATPLYPAYRELFNLTALQIMFIFGVYAAGVLVTLIITSKIKLNSSRYTHAIYLGLICVSVSSMLMMFAESIVMLASARFITGIGSGILMAYVNRSLLNIFSSQENNKAALYASFALVLGQALGPVVSGNALYYHFFELKTPFILLIIISVISMLAVKSYSSIINKPATIQSRNHRKSEKSDLSTLTISHVRLACAAIFLSWAMASTFMSQGPTVSQKFYNIANTQHISYFLSTFLAIAGLTQLLMRRAKHFLSLSVGISAQVIAMVLMMSSIIEAKTSLLACAVLIEGFAYGAILVGASATVNRVALHLGKAHLINMLYIIGYIGNWLPLILSIVMDKAPLEVALTFYVSICLVIAVAIMVFAVKKKYSFH